MTSHPRRRLQLRKPRGSIAGFPVWILRRNRALFRAHKANVDPWWFSNDGSGRFDLRGAHGTCYLASDAEGAVRERWGEDLLAFGFVPHKLAEATEVSQLRVPSGGRAADLCSAEAADYGVTREISTTGRYDVTQAWAEAFGPMGAKLLGIRYQPRFSTDSRGWALALFGDAGVASWPTDPNVVKGIEVAARLGIDVADVPSLPALSSAILSAPSTSP